MCKERNRSKTIPRSPIGGRGKNRRLRVTISHMRRHAPFEPIDPKTCVWDGVPDVISCANFFENWSRGLGHTPKNGISH